MKKKTHQGMGLVSLYIFFLQRVIKTKCKLKLRRLLCLGMTEELSCKPPQFIVSKMRTGPQQLVELFLRKVCIGSCNQQPTGYHQNYITIAVCCAPQLLVAWAGPGIELSPKVFNFGIVFPHCALWGSLDTYLSLNKNILTTVAFL